MWPAKQKTPKKEVLAQFDEDKVVSQSLDARTAICQKALQSLFPKLEGTLLQDYARISAFLMRPGTILLELDDFVQPAVDKIAAAHTNVSVSKVLRELLTPCGFAPMGGVYFVGDAGSCFDRVVEGKMLFVDGLSFVHGEFSHSIQWLILLYATNAGKLVITTNLSDLYQNSVRWKSEAKLEAEQGGQSKPKNPTVWDFCVDCFVPRNGQHCNLLTSLFSDSARAPAWVQKQLTEGDARWSVLGQLLTARDGRRQILPALRGATTLGELRTIFEKGDAKPDDLAEYYRQRALANMVPKPRVVFPNAPGALVPDPLHAHWGGVKKHVIEAAKQGSIVFDEKEIEDLYSKANKAKGLKGKSKDPFEKAWLDLYDH